jgi:predicted DNA-binding protein YlxM (UPF0122 family)
MERHELERRLEIGRLLDFYGPLITEHRREIARMYCEEDMSLAEIAQVMTESGRSVTRQGVYDAVVKAERQLIDYEKKLGLIERHDSMIAEAKLCLASLETGGLDAARAALRRMTEL